MVCGMGSPKGNSEFKKGVILMGITFTKCTTEYELITTIGDYAILKRDTSFEPYIAAYNFSFWEEGNEYVWGNGNYFDKQEEALLYAIYNTTPDISVGIRGWSSNKIVTLVAKEVE